VKEDEAVAQSKVKDLLSTGEVTLIETRQHWMAAVRFAMRPLLLILAVFGLYLLTQLLPFSEDGFFSFINDILMMIIVVMIIIAVIWLPIDLVRWDSRRYALTNRRAIRLEGVIRKNTFDSSLEQINDIGLVQTAVGRSLGYADLTLYTASDSVNETYEQLLDGLQFKKAVLDAKEGIRQGQPLTELTEGFIVKGGTNEASMRADGKIEDEEVEVDAAASEAPQEERRPVAPPPPVAPEPEPEPVVEPPETPSAPEPIAEPALVAESEPEPVVEPEPVAEPEPEPEPETEPEPVVEPEPEPEPVVEPEPATAEVDEKTPRSDGQTSV